MESSGVANNRSSTELGFLVMRSHRVLVIAAPYGYGPASKAIVFEQALTSGLDVFVASSGDSLDFIGRSVARGKLIDTCRDSPDQWLTPLLSSFDYFLSCMDTQSCFLLAKTGRAQDAVFFDSLTFWRSDFSFTAGLRAYICQFFPGSEVKMRGSTAAENVLSAPLVFPLPQERPLDDHVLVSFGGVSSPLASCADYENLLDCIATCLSASVQGLGLRTFITGNPVSVGRIGDHNPSVPATLEALSLDLFIARVASCQALVAAPGVETAFFAFAAKCPLIFLPPMNSTQAHQVLVFADLGFPVLFKESVKMNIVDILTDSDWRSQTQRIVELGAKLTVADLDLRRFEEILLNRDVEVASQARIVQSAFPDDLTDPVEAVIDAFRK